MTFLTANHELLSQTQTNRNTRADEMTSHHDIKYKFYFLFIFRFARFSFAWLLFQHNLLWHLLRMYIVQLYIVHGELCHCTLYQLYSKRSTSINWIFFLLLH